MKRKQLENLGVPSFCVKLAVAGCRDLAREQRVNSTQIKDRIREILAAPRDHQDDPHFGPFVAELIAAEKQAETSPKAQPIRYRTWGADGIDEQSHQQMRQACSLPMAAAGALMPDAHVGYGLPIGGVLGLENAVCPYAVGVDIACRMKLSILDVSPQALYDSKQFDRFRRALEGGTVFGVGKVHERKQEHEVMDRDWSITPITQHMKNTAWKQLGTSGSGNHFVEFGILTIPEPFQDLEPGEYVALMSHSGSRGVGHAVCSRYSDIARDRLPNRFAEMSHLAWLSMDSAEGQEYWAAMSLMGDYAEANHAVIHRLVTKLLGARSIGGVENHHNFAWKEVHNGKEIIVHRKGATPAGEGVLGVIPGSMGTPAYVVRGLGNPESLNSASHGAGRAMSRKKAKQTYRFSNVRRELAEQGIQILSAGSDEVPQVYKNIDEVMAQQSDLVEIVARFDPKVVKMCGDGSRAED